MLLSLPDDFRQAFETLDLRPELRGNRLFVNGKPGQIGRVKELLTAAGYEYISPDVSFYLRFFAVKKGDSLLNALSKLEISDQLTISDCCYDLQQRVGLDADESLELLASIGRLLVAGDNGHIGGSSGLPQAAQPARAPRFERSEV